MTEQVRVGYLKKDLMEKLNIVWKYKARPRNCSYMVRAVRLVDADGDDWVQPWPRTKGEARELAKLLNIKIVGELK